MKVLVIGSGGREHALAWRLQRDHPHVALFIAPGNAGTARLGTNLFFPATDLAALESWAMTEKPDLTVVGPEAPLCAGIVDRFEAAGLPIFGPREAAARLEGSKVFTKAFLLKNKLPTAPGASFADSDAARAYLRSRTLPQVIKADGLAAGKGVIIARTPEEADDAVTRIMDDRVFGAAGAAVVIEDFLPGREMSIHVLTDGRAHVILPISQDHKKLLDEDLGPNTGGMGAYAPAPFATPEIQDRVAREIVEPVLAAFRTDGLDFRGILYIGLIWTEAHGPQILEFNVRGGDPETQVLLPLLDTPLVDVLQAVWAQKLGECTVRFNSLKAVTVVMAAEGYPDQPVTGSAIEGLDLDLPGTYVFHGGTREEGKTAVSSGGRVLSVTAWADDLQQARERAYQRVAKIHFAGNHYRRDIAARLTL
jgi:phosphoribosylamine---glycine ligase